MYVNYVVNLILPLTFDNVKAFDSCSNLRTRRQLESVQTHLQSNSINRAIDLDSSYSPDENNLIV